MIRCWLAVLKRQPLRLLEHVKPGDLIAVDWCDASTGKSSMNGGAVDVPAKSWGIYLGIVEGRIKHIILAQNSFCFTDSAYDMDYTAIPLGWTIEVKILVNATVDKKIADLMVHSFAKSGSGQTRSTCAVGARSQMVFLNRMQRLRHIWPI